MSVCVCVDVMILTDWPLQMMVASSVLFAISDISCLINVFYSLSLLFRIFFCVCTDCCGRDLTSDEYRCTTVIHCTSPVSK